MSKVIREWRFYIHDILWNIIEMDIPALLKELELFKQKNC